VPLGIRRSGVQCDMAHPESMSPCGMPPRARRAVGARRTTGAAVALLLALVCVVPGPRSAAAQGASPPGPVRSGERAEVVLRHGDFVTATVSAPAAAMLRVVQPDGLTLRSWPVGPQPSRIAFIAVVEGLHRLDVVQVPGAPAGTAASATPGSIAIDSVTSLDARLQPRVHDDSPTMQRLRRQVRDGTWTGETFWADVTARGTPLVEPSDDPRYQLVTFLWRARGETRNVSVIGTFMKASLAEPLQPVAGTDVWYRTFRVPAGARFSYFLSPNAPLAFDGPDAAQQFATLQADPLNPRRWMCGAAADIYQCQSRAELPGAAAQPWVDDRPAVSKGRLESQSVTSRLLESARPISVYVSSDAACERERCVLLVLFDGPQYLSLVPTPTILDNLRADGRIPPVVALFVTHVSRARELAGNETFAAFVGTELIPRAQARYHAGRTARDVVVAGSSFGGLAAAFVALRHPAIVGNVLSQSGNFAWAPDHVAGPGLDATTEGGWLIKEYLNRPAQPIRVHLEAGVFEVDRFATGGAILESSRHFRDVLRAKGYDVIFTQFAGGHDYLSWRGTLADALIGLVGTKSP
jgi:enterochelin esterase-like enzyme